LATAISFKVFFNSPFTVHPFIDGAKTDIMTVS